jgi:hypothetical protein
MTLPGSSNRQRVRYSEPLLAAGLAFVHLVFAMSDTNAFSEL